MSFSDSLNVKTLAVNRMRVNVSTCVMRTDKGSSGKDKHKLSEYETLIANLKDDKYIFKGMMTR